MFHFKKWYDTTFTDLINILSYDIRVSLHVFMLSPFSHVWLFATLWTTALQASLSMGFSRQEYWSGLPCPPQGNLPDPGIELTSLLSPVLASEFFTISAIWEALFVNIGLILKSSAGSFLLSSFLHQNYAVYMKKILFSIQVLFFFFSTCCLFPFSTWIIYSEYEHLSRQQSEEKTFICNASQMKQWTLSSWF